MRKQTRACARKRVSERMHMCIWTRILIDQLFFCIDLYFSTPRAAGRAHMHACMHACMHASKCMRRLACCSACWWLTNGKGDTREKEVV